MHELTSEELRGQGVELLPERHAMLFIFLFLKLKLFLFLGL
jgi:hypothetical protein